jgi:hypothetical protein
MSFTPEEKFGSTLAGFPAGRLTCHAVAEASAKHSGARTI